MGYTPVFDHIYQGTLFGKWPTAAVWASLLPLCDKNGVISYSWAALTGMTGWPIDLLRQGVEDLMQPDPGSNSSVEAGKRLVSHDQHDGKDWGWRAVNHTKYREKCRKLNFDAARVEDGRNAERMQARRDPTRPAMTRDDPPSDTDTYSNKEKKETEARKARSASRLPEDFTLTEERRAVGQKENLDVERVFADFCDYWRSTSGAKARKLDWDATWRVWCRNQFNRPGSTKPAPFVAPEEFHA